MVVSGSNFNIAVAVETAAADRALGKLNRGLRDAQAASSGLGKSMSRLGLLLAATFSVRNIVNAADAFINIQNRLKVVTTSTLALSVAQQELLQLSRDTRTSFETNVEVFQRLRSATAGLGLSTSGLLGVMESLNQAVILSGATSIEATQALRQLTQGLGAGALKGDELRSVLEQLPTVADLIARQLGVTRGQLKDFGERSLITTKVIIDAFRNAREELSEKFAKVVPTIGQGFVLMRNEFIATVGKLNETTGAFTALAKVLQVVAANMEVILVTIGAVGAALALGLVAKGINVAIAAWKTYAAAQIAATAVTTTTTGINAATLAVQTLTTVVRVGTASWILWARSLIGSKAGILAALGLVAFATKRVFDAVGEGARLTREKLDALSRDAVELSSFGSRVVNLDRQLKALEKRKVISEGVFARIVELKTELRETEKILKVAREFGFSGGEAAAFLDVLKRLDREQELLFLSNKEREIQKRLDKELADLAKKKIFPNEAAKAEIETRLRRNQVVEREAEILRDIQGPQQQYQDDLIALQGLLDRNAISQEQFNQKRRELTEEFSPQLGPDAPDFSLIDRELDALRQQAQVQALIAAGREDEAAALQRINSLKQQVPVGPEQAAEIVALEQRNAALALGTSLIQAQINPARQLAKEMAAIALIAAETGASQQQITDAVNAAFLRSLEAGKKFSDGWDRTLLKLRAQATDFAAVAEASINAFATNATNALVSFAETGKFQFKEFARSLVSDLTRIIAQLLIVQALSAVLGVPQAPISSSQVPFPQGLASGGPVSPNRTYLVGEEGPELFRSKQAGNIVPNDKLGEAAAGPTIINVTNPNEIPQAISSGSSDNAIINVLTRNRDKVNRVLG